MATRRTSSWFPEPLGGLEDALALQPDNPALTALVARLHLTWSDSPVDVHALRAQQLADRLTDSAALDPTGPLLAEEAALARGEVAEAMSYGEEAATRIFAAIAEQWAASAAADAALDTPPATPASASPPSRRASWKLTTTDWRMVKRSALIYGPLVAIIAIVSSARGCTG